jgi:DNA polymerase I-like protein with 3'-5' exonuclease and polymerase domains
MATLVRAHMEGVVDLQVPLVVDIGIGPNWLDAKR